MRVLLDTNVLTRGAEPHEKNHQIAVDAVALLRLQGHELCLVAQNFYEYWVVSTRPLSQNGRGKSPGDVATEFVFLRPHFTLLPDQPTMLITWESLVTSYQVIGKQAHDARLVAAMLTHSVSLILTFNEQDFRRYPGIVPLAPANPLAGIP
jgi:predicted nucleic acid-binding protein